MYEYLPLCFILNKYKTMIMNFDSIVAISAILVLGALAVGGITYIFYIYNIFPYLVKARAGGPYIFKINILRPSNYYLSHGT